MILGPISFFHSHIQSCTHTASAWICITPLICIVKVLHHFSISIIQVFLDYKGLQRRFLHTFVVVYFSHQECLYLILHLLLQ